MRPKPLAAAGLIGLAVSVSAFAEAPVTLAARTAGLERHDGFLPYYWDGGEGSVAARGRAARRGSSVRGWARRGRGAARSRARPRATRWTRPVSLRAGRTPRAAAPAADDAPQRRRRPRTHARGARVVPVVDPRVPADRGRGRRPGARGRDRLSATRHLDCRCPAAGPARRLAPGRRPLGAELRSQRRLPAEHRAGSDADVRSGERRAAGGFDPPRRAHDELARSLLVPEAA